MIGAHALGARRLEVVDAVGARDDALERRRDEAAHEVGARPDVGGRHADDRDVAARVLPHAQRARGPEPGDQDHQVDDDGEDRAPDEEVRGPHQLSSGLGAGSFEGWTSLFTCTAAPLRSLKAPEVTTSAPGLDARDDRDLVAAGRRRASRTAAGPRCRAPRPGPSARLDDVHRVPVGRVADRRRGQGHDAALASPTTTRACTNMPGRRRPPGLAERRFDLDVAGGLVHDRVDGADPARQRARPADPRPSPGPRPPPESARAAAGAPRRSRGRGRAPAAARSGRRR